MAERYNPYYKISGGALPTAIGWGDIPSIADADVSFEGFSTDKVSFDGQIDAGLNTFYGIKWDAAQMKSVGSSGEPYKRIQDACNSILDSSATNPYTIDISAGIFSEQITINKAYVNIKGKGYSNTTIKKPNTTGAEITITTACNNGLIQFEGLTIETRLIDSLFVNVQATGLTIHFINCRFRLSESNTTTYVYNQPTSAGNTLHFVGCVFEVLSGLSVGQIVLFQTPSGITTDIVYLKNCILKDQTLIGQCGYSSVSSTNKYYIANLECDGYSSAGLCSVYGGNVYVEGGRWGKPEYSAGIFSVMNTYGILEIVGAHIYSQTGDNAVSMTNGGTLTIVATEISGGMSAVRINAGIATLKNCSIAKHPSGSGTDLYNGGGTINIAFCKYNTTTGTITKLDEDVDRIDGKHASATPTADTIPVSDGSAKVDGWVSGDKHNTGGDTALGTLGTKNPPIDADKSIYRDSTASDGLVTSTWTQIKAFLKTYWDTLYLAITGGTLTGNLAISKTDPIINLTDTDDSKSLYLQRKGGVGDSGECKLYSDGIYMPGATGNVGNPAIDRAANTNQVSTFIDKTVVATISGSVTAVQVYCSVTGLIKIKVFRSVGSDWVYIGESEQFTITGAQMTSRTLTNPITGVLAGDYIAWYQVTPGQGTMDADTSGGGGIDYKSGDITSNSAKATWSTGSNYIASVYGTVSVTGADVTRNLYSMEDGQSAGEGGKLYLGDKTNPDHSTYIRGNVKQIGEDTPATNEVPVWNTDSPPKIVNQKLTTNNLDAAAGMVDTQLALSPRITGKYAENTTSTLNLGVAWTWYNLPEITFSFDVPAGETWEMFCHLMASFTVYTTSHFYIRIASTATGISKEPYMYQVAPQGLLMNIAIRKQFTAGSYIINGQLLTANSQQVTSISACMSAWLQRVV